MSISTQQTFGIGDWSDWNDSSNRHKKLYMKPKSYFIAYVEVFDPNIQSCCTKQGESYHAAAERLVMLLLKGQFGSWLYKK